MAGLARLAVLAPLILLAGEVAQYRVTVHALWATDEPQKEKLPRVLEPLLPKLKTASKKAFFRIEGKPVAQLVTDQKPLAFQLPDGWVAKWSVAAEKGKAGLRQVIAHEKKKQQLADFLPRSPVITHLARIRSGKETLLLVVVFEKPPAK